jgi:excisionase family DNA binding protein
MASMDSTTPVSADTRTELPALLDAREVTALLGVSKRTVRRLAQDGVLARVRIGHRTSRYTRRSVLALIDPHNEQHPATTGALRKTTKALVEMLGKSSAQAWRDRRPSCSIARP